MTKALPEYLYELKEQDFINYGGAPFNNESHNGLLANDGADVEREQAEFLAKQ